MEEWQLEQDDHIMLQSLAVWVLQTYLGEYIENLNTDQLTVGYGNLGFLATSTVILFTGQGRFLDILKFLFNWKLLWYQNYMKKLQPMLSWVLHL